MHASDALAFPELFGPRGKDVVRFVQGLSYTPWLSPPSPVAEEMARGMAAWYVADHGLKVRGISVIEDHPGWSDEREMVRVTVQQTAATVAAATAQSLAGDLVWARDPNDQRLKIAEAIRTACEGWRRPVRSKEKRGVRRAAWDAACAVAESVAGYTGHLVAGIDTAPWTALVRLWEMGCCPLGISNEFYVVMVPRYEAPRRRIATGTPPPYTVEATDNEPTRPRVRRDRIQKPIERERTFDSIEAAIDDLTRTLDHL